ncbi:MAG: Gfo/Idh/MocA family protein [Chloroflexota bacterium]
MEVRWGFIGAGNITERRATPAGAFTQENSRVVAVARADYGRAQEYARAKGIPRAYGTAEELCNDPEVNAVYICSPHHLHKEHALLAFARGKHVLCEKPLAPTTADCAEMVRAADKAGVVFAVAFYRRFYPVVEKMREIVQSGRLGTLVTARTIKHDLFLPPKDSLAADRRSRWRTDPASAGGGVLNDAGSHRLDLLLYLLGDARAVAAEIDTFAAWYQVEDQACATIRFANRAIAQVDMGWCNGSACDIFGVAGTEGEVVVDDLEGSRLLLQNRGESEVFALAAHSIPTHRPVVADFVHVLNHGGSVRCLGADALRTTEIVEKAYLAARERRTVELVATVKGVG